MFPDKLQCELISQPLGQGCMTGSLTCHCGNTGVERTPNKSQHTKLTLEKKIFPPLLPGFELATLRLLDQPSYQQAIPMWLYPKSFILDASTCCCCFCQRKHSHRQNTKQTHTLQSTCFFSSFFQIEFCFQYGDGRRTNQ